MTLDEIKTALYKLEKLMYGYNFEVAFGIETFSECNDYDQFVRNFQALFPKATPQKVIPISFTEQEFWEDLNYCLKYRGDSVAGLELNTVDGEAVDFLQLQYKNFIKTYLTQGSQIFAYPDQVGIPGYPVFWDYRYIIFKGDGKALFTYGSSSD